MATKTPKHNLLDLFRNNVELEYETLPGEVNYHIELKGKTLHINFQCSDGTTDWINNFRFRRAAYERMSTPFRVHYGFLKCWQEVMPYIQEAIFSKKFEEIVIVGYSHGAAIAALCHEFCWYTKPNLRDKIYGYGFGAPRVIGKWFMDKSLKQRWKNFYVIRDNGDLVTHVPFVFFGYKHIGNLIKVKTKRKLNSIDSHRPESYIEALRIYENDRKRRRDILVLKR